METGKEYFLNVRKLIPNFNQSGSIADYSEDIISNTYTLIRKGRMYHFFCNNTGKDLFLTKAKAEKAIVQTITL